MPLNFANIGEKLVITRISGNDEQRRHLQNLGFVESAFVTVVSQSGGNVIVSIKESRIAISKEMASKIIVNPAL